ncbi:DsbA family oxidoreductase [Enterococcus sp. DIV0876]|uniref:DsbA family oxidoreductase n=1 Tax=Enterococcus sp. DIV0876 TaxID=2774633 RepID=UPI003D2FFFE6
MKQIDVHIDFACPFSYIGGEKVIQFLEKENLPLSSVIFRSYQLQPNDDNQQPNYLMNRFKASGMPSVEEYIQFFNHGIGMSAREIGLNYDVEKVISKNSRLAHIGLQYAQEQGKHTEYFRKVMSAHWEEGKDYSDPTVIEGILEELGLNLDTFNQNRDKYDALVTQDIDLADKRHIRGVPAFYKDSILPLKSNSTFEEFKTVFSA